MVVSIKKGKEIATLFGRSPQEVLEWLLSEADWRSKSGDRDWRDMWENVASHLEAASNAIDSADLAHDAQEGE